MSVRSRKGCYSLPISHPPGDAALCLLSTLSRNRAFGGCIKTRYAGAAQPYPLTMPHAQRQTAPCSLQRSATTTGTLGKGCSDPGLWPDCCRGDTQSTFVLGLSDPRTQWSWRLFPVLMILWFYAGFPEDISAFVSLSQRLVSIGHRMPEFLVPQKSFWVTTILPVPSGPTALLLSPVGWDCQSCLEHLD